MLGFMLSPCPTVLPIEQPLPLPVSLALLPLLSCNERDGPVPTYRWVSCTPQGGLGETAEGRSVKSNDLD